MVSLVNIIKKEYIRSNQKRPKKHKKTHNYYIKKILYILKTGISYRELKCNGIHYTTIHKYYLKLIEYGVFQRVFKQLISKYRRSHNTNLFFIDSTTNLNMYGIDNISKSYFDKKKYTKISIVVDIYGIPHNIFLAKPNNHDVSLVKETIMNDHKLKNCYLIGDKGYISPKLKNELKINNNIVLIYPYRKNQKTINSLIEKQLLKKRHIVENFFSWLKKARRVHTRYDKLSLCYQNFIYMRCSEIILNNILRSVTSY